MTVGGTWKFIALARHLPRSLPRGNPSDLSHPAPEPGKDAFHRVPFFPGEVRDAVERVPTTFSGAKRVNGRGILSSPKAKPRIGNQAVQMDTDLQPTA